MPSPKKVKVFVNYSEADGAITLSADPDPVVLQGLGHGNGAHVHWDIQTPGWVFETSGDGIRIANGGNRFKKIGDANQGRRYTWQREMVDGIRYKYTIIVTDGSQVIGWDPFLVNN